MSDTWTWKWGLLRAFLLGLLASFVGSWYVQSVVWPVRDHDEQRLLLASVGAVAWIAAAADFCPGLFFWATRRRRLVAR